MPSKAVPASSHSEFRELAEFGDIQSGDSPDCCENQKWALLAGGGSDFFCFYYLGGSLGACLSNKEDGMADAEMSAAASLRLLQWLVRVFGTHTEDAE